MSLIFLNDADCYPTPLRILNQRLGMGLNFNDLLSPMQVEVFPMCRDRRYCRPWQNVASKKDSGSNVMTNKESFQVNLDVQQFKPEEITVKVVDKNTVVIECKHEERKDEHGRIYRHFVRKYFVPEEYDVNGVISNLSSDGVLSISAPRLDKDEENVRNIAIQQTGEPIKSVQNISKMDEGAHEEVSKNETE